MLHVKKKLKDTKTRVNILKDTMKFKYQTRLDPEEFPGSVWNYCTSKTYFAAVKNRLFGGLVQARVITEDGRIV